MFIKRLERRGCVIVCEVNAYFGIVYITPGKLENVTFLLHLSPLSTLKRQENKAFRKRSLKWRNLKTPALRFQKSIWNQSFSKITPSRLLRIYSPEFASNTFRRWRVPDCDVFKFLWRSVNGKHLMRFESENFIFKLLWRNVNRALDDQAPSLLP